MKQGIYTCDCGSAAVRIGKSLVLYGNGVGDGEYDVFEFDSEKEFDEYCNRVGVHDPHFIGSATFREAQVVDCDCGCIEKLNTLFELDGRYGIYNSNISCWNLAGQVYFVKWEN